MTQPKAGETLREGPWRMQLDLNKEGSTDGALLPFLFDLDSDSTGWHMLVHNGSESIHVEDIVLRHDTLRVRLPLFDSEFQGIVKNDSTITGLWYNYLKGPDYRVPFLAQAGAMPRFAKASTERPLNVTGEWETHFSRGTPDSYSALGMFTQTGDRVTGTFCTETGDYRFLEGTGQGDSLLLSAFDGSHAFLFHARMDGDTLRGRYWSGVHWQEPFVAWKHPGYALRNADSLTFLKEGYTMANFRFPGIDGDSISPKDAEHEGHVLMVQIMGSWCPNCVDETLLLDSMYAEYHARGLDVIAVAFERYEDPVKAIASLRRFRDRLNVKYDIAYAGAASKDAASSKLPFLDHIISYPTCIFIDRTGNVRRIRTGFYGPSTGEHYASYGRNLRTFLEKMLTEDVRPVLAGTH